MNREPNIGDCVYVLFHKLWGKTAVKGRLKSQLWWQRKLDSIINGPTIELPKSDRESGIYSQDGNLIPPPIPFEIEVGISDLTYDMLLVAWKKVFPLDA